MSEMTSILIQSPHPAARDRRAMRTASSAVRAPEVFGKSRIVPGMWLSTLSFGLPRSTRRSATVMTSAPERFRNRRDQAVRTVFSRTDEQAAVQFHTADDQCIRTRFHGPSLSEHSENMTGQTPQKNAPKKHPAVRSNACRVPSTAEA